MPTGGIVPETCGGGCTGRKQVRHEDGDPNVLCSESIGI